MFSDWHSGHSGFFPFPLNFFPQLLHWRSSSSLSRIVNSIGPPAEHIADHLSGDCCTRIYFKFVTSEGSRSENVLQCSRWDDPEGYGGIFPGIRKSGIGIAENYLLPLCSDDGDHSIGYSPQCSTIDALIRIVYRHHIIERSLFPSDIGWNF